jgi:hypothetical protein
MAQDKAQLDGATHQLNVRVERETFDRFREVAAASHRTVSQELRHLMEQRIAEADTQAAAA